jgi:kynurenine formamidase
VKVLDLTQPLGERTLLWPGSMPFRADGPDAHDEEGYWARDLHFGEHSGTHLDAPLHCVPGGAGVADIPAERLVRPAVRIDARELCGGDASWTLRAEDVRAWEAEHGPIGAGAAVLLCTGWDAYVEDFGRYLGDPLDYPGYGGDAAALLVQRGVAGIGIDTLGVDSGRNASLSPVHKTTLPAGLWHLEGLVGLADVPPVGATLVVGVPPLVGGSGMPARVLALLP